MPSVPLRRARARLAWLAAPALLFLICCGMYWKLVLSRQYTWTDGADLVHMEIPRLQFQRVAWHSGELPLWDPYQWCGQPFLGQVTGAAFPGHWLFSLLPFNREGRIPLGQLHWYFLIVHWLGGLFCYWLCRDIGCSFAPSIAGAMVFAFSGFFTVANWPVVMVGLMWAPLVFLFLLRAASGVKPMASAALSGLFLGISWLSGHHEIPTYMTVAVGAVWLYLLLWPAQRNRWEVLRLAVVAFGIMALAGGLQILPAYEYGLRARRWAGAEQPLSWKEAIPYAVHVRNGLQPSSLPALIIAWFGPETNAYLGVVAVALAALGALRRWRLTAVRVFVGLFVAAALLSLSGWNIFHGFLYAVLPIFGKARNPARLLSMVDFAAAPLAACGLDVLLARLVEEAPALRRFVLALAAFGGGIYLVMIGSRVFGIEPRGEFTTFSALMALLAAALFTMWRKAALERPAFLALALMLIAVDMGIVASAFPEYNAGSRPTWLPHATAYKDIVSFLKKQPQPLRVFWDGEPDEINLGDWDGVESFRAFSAAATANLIDLELGHLRQQDLLGLTYTVAKARKRDDQEEVFTGSSGYKVFRNLHAFPRTWTVHEVFHARNSAEVIGRVRDEPAFDLRTHGVMTAPPPALEQCKGAPAESPRIVARGINYVTIEANMQCRGIVVLGDVWFPGWRATVDGRSSPEVLEMYGCLRGVVVDSGPHRIEFKYRPSTAMLGGAMSALGLFAALGLVFVSRQRPWSSRTPLSAA
jgi:hypothetical protein